MKSKITIKPLSSPFNSYIVFQDAIQSNKQDLSPFWHLRVNVVAGNENEKCMLRKTFVRLLNKNTIAPPHNSRLFHIYLVVEKCAKTYRALLSLN